MVTRCWRIDKDNPEREIIGQAAALLRAGGLVAFPTETVYGLGACADNPGAVRRIFEVKGRLPQSALLVHISRTDQAAKLVPAIPPLARELMGRFWPGPLAIILPASPRVPPEVSGGRPTVGLRMPAHPVALALIDQAGPLAAPSANLSGRPSPVTANHVHDDLGGQIAGILDAGPTGIGLESTIIDLSRAEPAVVRFGGVPLEELQRFVKSTLHVPIHNQQIYKTGRMAIVLCAGRADWQQIISEIPTGDTALVDYDESPHKYSGSGRIIYKLKLREQNTDLFSIMRDAEARGFSRLVFAPLPAGLAGLAGSLAERIKRAAGVV